MKDKIFLDCGQFDGVAIEQYCVDDSWTIYSFEPDPKPLPHLPMLNLIQQAVWTEDGEVSFSLDPRQQASHITGIAGTDFENTTSVKSIDFSKFVANLPAAEIICSMDIEGAEFPVLRKMIKDGTIKRIKVLDIEFHHRMMNDEDDESARKLVQELWNLGVVVRLKIVLNK
jgi:FkbM family methyltransferase